MSSRTAPLALRLFLEGVEVPVISAQINIQPSVPASAAIQIIPTDAVLSFLPRTLVHMFVLESYISEDMALAAMAGNAVNESMGGSNLQKNRFEFQDENYILCYSGEVVGINYGKSPVSRNVVLQCLDLSSYWDTCYQWFADYSPHGNALSDKVHTFVGSNKGLFDSIARGAPTVISRLLNTKPRTPEYENAGGLLGGLIHLLEAVGGVQPRKREGLSGPAAYKGGLKGVSDFFTIAEARYNLLGMLGAVEEDQTAVRIYSGKAFRSWLKNGMSSLGNLVTFRDIVRQVGQWIFHDVYPNPAPYIVERAERKKKVKRTTYIKTAVGQSIFGQLSKAYQSYESAWDSLQEFNTATGEEASTQFSTAQTALSQGAERIKGAQDLGQNLGSDDKATVRADLTKLAAAANKLKAMVNSTAGTGRERAQASRIIKDVGGTRTSQGAYTSGILKQLKELVDKAKADIGRKSITVPRGSHMYNQLVLPETYFVPPPQCNVIFPDQFYSLSYSRNFMREITRLSCQGGLSLLAGRRGAAKLLARSYYAPAIRDISGKTLYATKSGARILLPHDLHSGIIPKFSWVTSGHRWGAKAAKNRGRNDKFFQAGKVGYVQRLAHFQFYLYRWAARQMQVESTFNPYLVLGLPSLVIDRPALGDEAEKKIGEFLGRPYLPTQFLGKIASIAHHLNQDGGRTMTAMTHCRTHRGEDDEFLGALVREERKKVRRRVKIHVRRLIKNAGKKVSGGKRRSYFLSVVNLYLSGKLVDNKAFLSRGEKIVRHTPSPKTFSMSRQDAKAAGLSVDGESSVMKGQDAVEVPVLLTLTTEGFRATGQFIRSGLAIEDALRPGWYDDAWSRENIGEQVYQHLLGTYAIHDNAVVSGSELGNLIGQAYADGKITQDKGKKVKNDDGDEVLDEIEYEFEDDAGTTTKIEKLGFQAETMEVAIDALALIYGTLKTRGLDVHRFIYDYTRRPVANMIEVLGSQNLEYNDLGEPLDPTTMKEGFHSRAFGDYNADVDVSDITGKVKAGKSSLVGLYKDVEFGKVVAAGQIPKAEKALNPALDPRGRARARVLQYKKELDLSRGLRGI